MGDEPAAVTDQGPAVEIADRVCGAAGAGESRVPGPQFAVGVTSQPRRDAPIAAGRA